MPARIARFHTTYGPYANWEGGREKAAMHYVEKLQWQ